VFEWGERAALRPTPPTHSQGGMGAGRGHRRRPLPLPLSLSLPLPLPLSRAPTRVSAREAAHLTSAASMTRTSSSCPRRSSSMRST